MITSEHLRIQVNKLSLIICIVLTEEYWRAEKKPARHSHKTVSQQE